MDLSIEEVFDGDVALVKSLVKFGTPMSVILDAMLEAGRGEKYVADVLHKAAQD